MNYYRRYIGDFQRDTGHLSLVEVGAYDRLLDHYYATEAPLPVSMDVLCRIARAVSREEQAAVKSVADSYFPVRTNERHNKRADHEIGVSRKARDNGKGGGRPRTGTITGTETGSVTEHETGEQTGSVTGEQTDLLSGEGGGSVHPPTTNHQPPSPNRQPPPSNHHKKNNGKGNGSAQAPFVLPEWIPVEQWQAWIDARKKKRNAPTDYAMRLAVMKLDNLRAEGHAPAQVLMQSAFNGWTGLFPPKEIR